MPTYVIEDTGIVGSTSEAVAWVVNRIHEQGALAPVRITVEAVPDPSAPIEGKVNAHSPETAQEAARTRSHLIAWGNDRTRILMALCGRLGFSDRQNTCAALADHLGMTRNQCASRLLELREMGMVEYVRDDAGQVVTRSTGPNARGRVQQVTELGQLAFDEVYQEIRQ